MIRLPERWRPVRAALGLLILALAACAKPAPPPVVPRTAPVADLLAIPQDPAAFAVGPDASDPLIPAQTALALTEDFIAAHFKPWRAASASPKKEAAAPLRAYAAKPGYGRDNLPNPPDFGLILEVRAGLENYPNCNRPGIILAQTDLRALPTADPSFLDPTKPGEGYPFDYLQYTPLPQGTPVLARHLSRDRAWAYVETGTGVGWVRTSALAFVDPVFMAGYQTGLYAAVILEGFSAPLIDAPGSYAASLGAVFPVRRKASGELTGLCAVDQGGMARLASFRFSPADAAVIPMPATKAQVASLAAKLAGQAYGWGGLDGKRDCSLMLRDLFAPFGLWLPRNSAAQARYYSSIPLAGLGDAQKEEAIVRQGVPFLTLIYLPGHIGLYLGSFQGRPVMFHNVWGVRTLSASGQEGRCVIGKAVVTTLSPGRELPDYDAARSIISRVESMTILGR